MSASPSFTINTLQPQLDAIRAKADTFIQSTLSPEEKASYDSQFINSNNPYPVPSVGNQAPNFTLKDSEGNQVNLESLIAEGQHIILLWYRGEWCPYCSAMLKAHNERVGDYEKLNGRVYAITPTLPSITAQTKSKWNLQFPILTDLGNATAKAYGSLNQLNEDLTKVYTRLGQEWEKYYGDNTHTLPHPGTFIIEGKTGKVAFSRVEMDYRKRVEPSEILTVLQFLSQ
jgi:peroxiredoxin